MSQRTPPAAPARPAAAAAARWLLGAGEPAPATLPDLCIAVQASPAAWAAVGCGDPTALAAAAGLGVAAAASPAAAAALDAAFDAAATEAGSAGLAAATAAAVATLAAAGAPPTALASLVALLTPVALHDHMLAHPVPAAADSPAAALATAPPPAALAALLAAHGGPILDVTLGDWLALYRAGDVGRRLAAWATTGASAPPPSSPSLPWAHAADARSPAAACLLDLLDDPNPVPGFSTLLAPPAAAAAGLVAAAAAGAAVRAEAAGRTPPATIIVSEDADLLAAASTQLSDAGVAHTPLAGGPSDPAALAAAAAAAGAPHPHDCVWLVSLTDCDAGGVPARCAAIARLLGDAGAVAVDPTGPHPAPGPTALPHAHLDAGLAALRAASGGARPAGPALVAAAAGAGLVPRPALGARLARAGVPHAVMHVDALPLTVRPAGGADGGALGALFPSARPPPPHPPASWVATAGDGGAIVAALVAHRTPAGALVMRAARVDTGDAAVAADVALCLLSTVAFAALVDDSLTCIVDDRPGCDCDENAPTDDAGGCCVIALNAWVSLRAASERRAQLAPGMDLASLALLLVGRERGESDAEGGDGDGDDGAVVVASPPPPRPPTLRRPSEPTILVERVLAVILSETGAMLASMAPVSGAARGAPAPPLAADASFAGAGLDSLDLMRAAASLSVALDVVLAPTALFDHPTPALLAVAAAAAPRRGGRPHPAPPRWATLTDALAPPRGDGGESAGGGSLARVLARRSSVAPAVGAASLPPPPPLMPAHRDRLVWIAAIELRAAGPAGDVVVRSFGAEAALAADAARPVPLSRWPTDGTAATSMARHAATLRGVASFDAAAFGLAPAAAAAADPQQRLVLEAAAALLALAPGRPARASVSVIIGVSGSDAASLAAARDGGADPSPLAASSGAPSVVPGRVAYTFDLAGDAAAVDTACSSALVATAVAARATRAAAGPPASIAGAVGLLLAPRTHASYAVAGMLAPDGRCKALDEGADGYGRADAIGALALAAEREAAAPPGDVAASWASLPGRALLAASCVNQDGRSASLTAPSGPAQASLLAGAAAASGGASSIATLALHGTGTPLGDPIEAGAAAAALGRAGRAPLALAAPKSSSGHAEAAAGVVSLAVVLRAAVGRGGAPVAHLRTVNPFAAAALSSASRPLAIARAPTVAPSGSASVSAFAFQGTNAHAVVGAGPAPDAAPLAQPALLFSRRRCWPTPPPRAVLGWATAAGGGVEFAAATGPALAALARGGDPACLLLELALAALRSVTHGGSPGLMAVALAPGVGAPDRVSVDAGGRVRVGAALAATAAAVADRRAVGGGGRTTLGAVRARLPPPAASGLASPARAAPPAGAAAFAAHPAALGALLAPAAGGRRLATISLLHSTADHWAGGGWAGWREGGAAAAGGGPHVVRPSFAQPPAPARDAPPALTYSQVWLVSSPAERGRRGGGRRARAPAAAAAASFLGAVARAAASGAAVPLLTVAATPSCASPCPAAARTPAAARALAVARSARAEAPRLRFAAVDSDGWGATAPAHVPPTDGPAFGRADAGGARVEPRLARAPSAARCSSPLAPAAALVTGGTGGLGRLIVDWLHLAGGRASVALGRGARGAQPPRAGSLVATDASAAADAADAAHWCAHNLAHPLTALFHAAGALADAPLARTRPARLRAAAAPKAAGAAATLASLAALPTAVAILFSSVASLVGPPGSAAYGGANAALDTGAASSQAAGRPAVALQWGAWSSIGMVATSDAVGRAMWRGGLPPLAPADALRALAHAVAAAALPPVIAVLAADWNAFRASGKGVAALAAAPFFDGVCGEREEQAAPAAAPAPAPTAAPPPAPPPDARAAAAVAAALTAVLGVTPADPHALLAAAGLDSLAAVELRDELAASLGVPLPATLAFDAPTTAALVDRVAAAVRGKGGVGAPAAVARAPLAPGPPSTAVAVTSACARLPPAGAETARVAPLARWDADSGPAGGHARAHGARWARWLPRAASFDAASFRVPHGEAVRMDPQQRLMLEASAEVLAGWGGSGDARGSASPPTAVAACVSFWDYASLLAATCPAPDAGDAYAATGKCFSVRGRSRDEGRRAAAAPRPTPTTLHPQVAAGRVAFTFDLHGPALAVDTACSSSLVAASLLTRSVARGDARRALLAAALLSLDPAIQSGLGAAGMLSPDGRVKALDAAADGYGRGEGVVALGLATATEAAASPTALLILSAIAVNQDGRSASLTAPSGRAQAAAALAALATARAAPAAVACLEMHGTGTPLGDPIELAAAVEVLGGEGGAPLGLAAAKTARGHAEPAAGAVGLLAAWGRLANGCAPLLHHLTATSPNIVAALAGGARRASAPRAAAPAQRSGLAGVSAFAFQGTNAHALVSVEAGAAGSPATAARLPWRRERVWCAPARARLAARAAGAAFATDLSSAPLAFLWQHVVRRRPLLPGTAMLEAAAAAVGALADGRRAAVAAGAIKAPLLLPKDAGRDGRLSLTLVTTVDGGGGVSVASGAALLLAASVVVVVVAWTPAPVRRRSALAGLVGRHSHPRATATATVALPLPPAADSHRAHPAQLDAATHLGALADVEGAGVAIPSSMGLLVTPAPAFRARGGDAACGPRARVAGGGARRDFALRASHGVASLMGLVSKPLGVAAAGTGTGAATAVVAAYAEEWQAAAPAPPALRRCRAPRHPSLSALAGTLAGARGGRATTAGGSAGPSPFPPSLEDTAARAAAACAALEPGSLDPPPPAPAAGGVESRARLLRSPRLTPPPPPPPGSTWLVVGGTGGLGSLAATFLASSGAGVVAVGRRARGAPPPAARGLVTVAAADAASAADVADVLTCTSLQPHGLLLAGGALADGPAARVRPAAARAAAAPKVAAAVSLAAATAARPLACTSSFTSASGVVGNPGQAAYGGANGALAALAASARAAGLPASDAGWGPWAAVGMAASRGGLLDALARDGLLRVAPAAGLAALAALAAAAAGATLVGAFDWELLLRRQTRRAGGRFDEFDAPRSAAEAAQPAREPPPPPSARPSATLDYLALVLAALRTVVGVDVPPSTPLADAGVDSLGALALRDALSASLGGGVPLPATLAFDYPTAAALAVELEARHRPVVRGGGEAVARAPPRPPPPPPFSTATVAILGAGCAFPGAPTPAAFLAAATSATCPQAPVPLDRWCADRLFSADAAVGKSYARLAATLPGFDAIDAAWCRLAPADAAALDPSCRRLLETAATARAAAAAATPSSEPCLPAAATFVGCMFYDASDVARRAYGVPSTAALMTGVGSPYLAGRAAFHFGASGPCVGVDTACSSSLVALHSGRQGEKGGEKGFRGARAGRPRSRRPPTLLPPFQPSSRPNLPSPSSPASIPSCGETCARASARCARCRRPAAAARLTRRPTATGAGRGLRPSCWGAWVAARPLSWPCSLGRPSATAGGRPRSPRRRAPRRPRSCAPPSPALARTLPRSPPSPCTARAPRWATRWS